MDTPGKLKQVTVFRPEHRHLIQARFHSLHLRAMDCLFSMDLLPEVGMEKLDLETAPDYRMSMGQAVPS